MGQLPQTVTRNPRPRGKNQRRKRQRTRPPPRLKLTPLPTCPPLRKRRRSLPRTSRSSCRCVCRTSSRGSPKHPRPTLTRPKRTRKTLLLKARPSQRPKPPKRPKPPQKPHLRRRKRLRRQRQARKRKPRERRRKRRPRQRTSPQPQQRPPQQPSRVKVRRQRTPLPQNNKQFWTQVFIIDNNYNNLYYIEKNNNHP